MILIDGSAGVQDAARNRLNGATALVVSNGLTGGFKGTSRSSSSTIIARLSGLDTSASSSSESPQSSATFVFARAGTGSVVDSPTDARLAFYSIGESLDLALLDARVTALITAFGVAIP
jgi:hypothetical protein